MELAAIVSHTCRVFSHYSHYIFISLFDVIAFFRSISSISSVGVELSHFTHLNICSGSNSHSPDLLCIFFSRKIKKKQEKMDKLCSSFFQRLINYKACTAMSNIADDETLSQWLQVSNSTNSTSIDTSDLSMFEKSHIIYNALNMTGLEDYASTTNTPQPVLPPFSTIQTILIAICLGVCILLTVGGNILVLLAFIVDRNIRQPSNYFIASLACTDMLIGNVFIHFVTLYKLAIPRSTFIRERVHIFE